MTDEKFCLKAKEYCLEGRWIQEEMWPVFDNLKPRKCQHTACGAFEIGESGMASPAFNLSTQEAEAVTVRSLNSRPAWSIEWLQESQRKSLEAQEPSLEPPPPGRLPIYGRSVSPGQVSMRSTLLASAVPGDEAHPACRTRSAWPAPWGCRICQLSPRKTPRLQCSRGPRPWRA